MPKTDTTQQPEREFVVVTAVLEKAVPEYDRKSVRRISDVVANQPEAVSLRDHPEFDGMDLTVMGVKFDVGDFGSFVVVRGYVCPPSKDKPGPADARVIMVEADQVYAKILTAYALEALPVRGTLRKSRRSWFLD